MHEISLCESIRDLLEDQAREQGFARVNRVWLEVGPLSCVEPEALRFGFDAVMRGSVAEGAALDIVTPKARARCPACNRVCDVERRYEVCPDCGMPGLEVLQGDELRIRKLEVV
jgi:hydrogenase nickel incorporation protein HypA/HybF